MTAEAPKYEALVDTWRSGYRAGLAAAYLAAIECGGDVDAIRESRGKSKATC